jgi:hypothetical protein
VGPSPLHLRACGVKGHSPPSMAVRKAPIAEGKAFLVAHQPHQSKPRVLLLVNGSVTIKAFVEFSEGDPIRGKPCPRWLT